MHILIADDDQVSRTLLVRTVEMWGHEAEVVGDGVEAVSRLIAPHAPLLAILDWGMPGLEGPDVCRSVRAAALRMQPYLVMLTARHAPEDLAVALEAGADDFLSKPFNRVELMARLHAGMRILNLHRALTDRIQELEESRQREQHLRTLTPICSVLQEDPRRQGRLGADRPVPRRARLPLHARGLSVVPRHDVDPAADPARVAARRRRRRQPAGSNAFVKIVRPSRSCRVTVAARVVGSIATCPKNCRSSLGGRLRLRRRPT